MIRVLRTIAIVDTVAVAVFGAVGWVFGLSPIQTLGAGIIGLGSIALVLAWRAIVNATPGSRPRQDWTPAPRLPVTRVTAEIVEPPALKLIEAPRRELLP